ncbi:hypothetical protein, partial [Providencia rettgeri]|uniref:hypothetical protein n=1 Tax=Providencia rettgeri TaxID=587 RepID=UPI001BCA88FB
MGQLGAVHALDALAFGLRFALLLLGELERQEKASALARASRSSASWSCCWPFLLRSPVRRSMALAVGPRWRV